MTEACLALRNPRCYGCICLLWTKISSQGRFDLFGCLFTLPIYRAMPCHQLGGFFPFYRPSLSAWPEEIVVVFSFIWPRRLCLSLNQYLHPLLHTFLSRCTLSL